MQRCGAVRRQGSTDPCPSNALRGHTLCGRHARMRAPTLWATVNQAHQSPLAKLQGWVRGHLLRRRLSLAGPGVLRRTNLANEEDFATCHELSRIHPLEYFEFEENGKTWGFVFESLWRWIIRSPTPVNPYTKVPLSIETRRRLREVWMSRFRKGVVRQPESDNPAERTRYRWTVLCHHFADYGFAGTHPETFQEFTRLDLLSMFTLLERDIQVVIPATHPFRERILSVCRRRALSADSPLPGENFSLRCANSLLYILSLPSDPYVLTFSILSAFYRC